MSAFMIRMVIGIGIRCMSNEPTNRDGNVVMYVTSGKIVKGAVDI